jgi:hypothetical protein
LHPAELATIGDEESLAAAIDQYFEAGAMDGRPVITTVA